MASDGVELAVVDQGIGIEARDLDRIFERFYRADKARSRATGGTGLGLAIVKHIATNHAGKVGVTSAVGEGSTFTLRLPASPPEAVLPLPPSVEIDSDSAV
jgi:two-component system sensor histidine kinase SenX3